MLARPHLQLHVVAVAEAQRRVGSDRNSRPQQELGGRGRSCPGRSASLAAPWPIAGTATRHVHRASAVVPARLTPGLRFGRVGAVCMAASAVSVSPLSCRPARCGLLLRAAIHRARAGNRPDDLRVAAERTSPPPAMRATSRSPAATSTSPPILLEQQTTGLPAAELEIAWTLGS